MSNHHQRVLKRSSRSDEPDPAVLDALAAAKAGCPTCAATVVIHVHAEGFEVSLVHDDTCAPECRSVASGY